MRLLRLDDAHPLTGWHMLAIVSVFFAVIIAVNVVMAFAATGTFPGLVVQNSYVASQRYNELLADARAQDAKGWQARLSPDDGILRFALSDRGGTPARGLRVKVRAGRPSTTREDRSLDFAPLADGSYQARERLPVGRWEVDLEARRGDRLLFRRTQAITIPAREAGK
ncbi:MAG TPA: FixH family protein [Propylenella sp.]